MQYNEPQGHVNPLKKIIASPLIRHSGFKTPLESTPTNPRRDSRTHHQNNSSSTRSASVHRIKATRSPHQLASNFHEREIIQDEILRLLEDNTKMMSMLTDFDDEIRNKMEQISSEKQRISIIRNLRQSSNCVQDRVRAVSPIMKQLKVIKHKLSAIDIRRSVQENTGILEEQGRLNNS